ncbi:Ppx/GppA phosphatase family protein [Corynebacterium uterequi]|uniref:Ppx/GppA phosphatase family n=1 Tax=Corynebacterium uterequi TaxID=1072256 RepID=A0A0G3HI05_9CORY|nr:Ppx/GppA phosphatase family protein [Corynebacterium uterequi]AKK10762.1 Ppx/GppA phosphatase family [Corynebacterium uterequi]
MTRVAAVDCGTNALRLLISDDGREVVRLNEIVRLGEGVDATGRISQAALDRTRAVLTRYAEIIRFEGVTAVRMVATSATRDAENKEDFFAMTEEVLGVRAEVISGQEEAELSFRGAILDLERSRGPFCVIDLGGGSTEFVVGGADGEIYGAKSVQMGCVRLTERIMRSDPPTDTEVEIAEEYVAERISEVLAEVPVDKARTFVGVAGTFTTLSALAQGLETYDPAEIHCSELRFDALRVITRELVGSSSAQRASHPVIHPGRADVIAGGAVAVEGIINMVERLETASSIVISEKDILDGIVSILAAS